MPGGGLAIIMGGGGSRQFQGSPRGVHEEIGVQEGGEGCLILQFCFMSKKCVHCCPQY